MIKLLLRTVIGWQQSAKSELLPTSEKKMQNTRKTHLKVKIKSLAAEAVIIKREEAKWKQFAYTDPQTNFAAKHPMFWSLRQHRLQDVRKECRHATIAYGYLRGRAYKQIEAKCHEAPIWSRVADIVINFSGYKYATLEDKKKIRENVEAWRLGDLVQGKAA